MIIRMNEDGEVMVSIVLNQHPLDSEKSTCIKQSVSEWFKKNITENVVSLYFQVHGEKWVVNNLLYKLGLVSLSFLNHSKYYFKYSVLKKNSINLFCVFLAETINVYEYCNEYKFTKANKLKNLFEFKTLTLTGHWLIVSEPRLKPNCCGDKNIL